MAHVYGGHAPGFFAVAISSVSLSPTHRMWAWDRDSAFAACVRDGVLSLLFWSSCRMRGIFGFGKIIAQAEQANFFALAIGISRGDKGELITALDKGSEGGEYIGERCDGFHVAGIVGAECPFYDVGRDIVMCTEYANGL